MEEHFNWPAQTADATPKPAPVPKTYEECVADALASIASDLGRIRSLLENIVEPESSNAFRAAIRTTGR